MRAVHPSRGMAEENSGGHVTQVHRVRDVLIADGCAWDSSEWLRETGAETVTGQHQILSNLRV